MEIFGMDDNELEKMIATHPLTVFSKLVADSPDNKVYQQCLDSEVHNVAESLSECVVAEQLEMIEYILRCIPDGVVKTDDKEFSDMLMNAAIIRRVIAEVRRIKGW